MECMVTMWYLSMAGRKKGSSESRLFVIERSERVKGELRAKVFSFDPPIIDLYILFAKHMSPLQL